MEARDRQTDGQHRYIMGPPSRKDGSIIIVHISYFFLNKEKLQFCFKFIANVAVLQNQTLGEVGTGTVI